MSQTPGYDVGYEDNSRIGHLIFHARSQQRTLVPMDAALRAVTLQVITHLHALIASARIPSAVLKPQCDGCSLREVCLPEAAARRTGDLFG